MSGAAVDMGAIRRAVRAAIADGTLMPARLQDCQDCSEPAKHLHHPDYSRPLHVVPLCYKCHGRAHAGRKPSRPDVPIVLAARPPGTLSGKAGLILPSTARETLGAQLEGIRHSDDRARAWVAKRLDVSRATIASWETGQTAPGLGALRQFFDLFRVPADYRARVVGSAVTR